MSPPTLAASARTARSSVSKVETVVPLRSIRITSPVLPTPRYRLPAGSSADDQKMGGDATLAPPGNISRSGTDSVSAPDSPMATPSVFGSILSEGAVPPAGGVEWGG